MSITQTRIANTIKKIEKEEKKLERIKVALAGGKNPYYYSESDLRKCEGELRYLAKRLKEYQDKAKKEEEEKNNRVPIIEEFLDSWAEKAMKFHEEEYEELKKFQAEHRAKEKAFKEELKEKGIHYWYGQPEIVKMEKERGIDGKTYREVLMARFSSAILECSQWGEHWREQLVKIVEREKNAKRKILMNRVAEIVGVITDAKGLYIGDNGEINGFIVGEKSRAEVRTIWAGGYNIQCLHFRVLVKDLGL